MEVPEAKTRKFPLNLFEASLERYIGHKVLERAVGIIGVTPEIVEYELSRLTNPKPAYCYPNGIDLGRYRIVQDRRKGIPKFIFVASFDAPWHGVDLLLKELGRTKNSFELHLVGDISLKTYSDDNRFVYHGLQDERYIDDLVSKCDVGLGSFALFRKHMTQACPLKIRQYLAMGLPVFSGHIDSGLPVNFPFYKHDSLNAEKLLAFAQESRMYSREEVRSESSKYIDKTQLMEKLLSWIGSVQNS
jgi:hypothetical protein